MSRIDLNATYAAAPCSCFVYYYGRHNIQQRQFAHWSWRELFFFGFLFKKEIQKQNSKMKIVYQRREG